MTADAGDEIRRVREWYNLVADDFVRRYDGELGWYLARCEEDLVHAVCDFAGRDVLDLGTGAGRLLPRLAQWARRAVGIDISEALLARAGRPPRTTVLQMDAFRLGFRDQSFDTVVSLGLCEYVADLAPFLTEASRVLRPGGQIGFTYHQVALYGRLRDEPPMAPYFGRTVAERSRYWSKRRHRRRAIRRALAAAGFTHVRLYRVFFRSPQLAYALAGRDGLWPGAAHVLRWAALMLERGLGRWLHLATQFTTGNVLVVARKR